MKNKEQQEYRISHPALIDMVEKALRIKFSDIDSRIICGYEEKATKISSFTDIILQMATRYIHIKGISNIRLMQHRLIDCIHLYREDSFFRENNMDKNNKIRLELQRLIDQLHLSKNAMDKLAQMVIVENEDLSTKLDMVKNNVDVLLDYLEQKKNGIQFIATANVL